MRRTLRNLFGRVTGPVLVAVLAAAGLAVSTGTSSDDPVDLPDTQPVLGVEGQVHYLPFAGPEFLAMLRGEHGSDLPGAFGTVTSPVRLLASMVSALDGNDVYIDHWEDGYDADPVVAQGPTTEHLQLDEGETHLLSNDVNTALAGQISPGGGAAYYDGGDRVVSTGAVVITAGGWPSGPGNAGTLHANAAVVPDIDAYGFDFTAPVGEAQPFPSGSPLASLWEWTGFVIVAAEDDTSVSVDGAGSYTLDAGETQLIDGDVDMGEGVHADKPVLVYLATGDQQPSSTSYEGRIFQLTPTERWSDSYMTPVGARNIGTESTRVFLYNPSASDITVAATDTGGAVTNITVPGLGQANHRLPVDASATFTSPGNQFYALQAITTPENSPDNSAVYNWGLALTPMAELTPMVVVGYGPGSETLATNDSGVYISAVAPTTVYIDFDANPDTGPNVDPDGNQYDISCVMPAGNTPWVVKDIGAASACVSVSSYSRTGVAGTGLNDMTGARLYTTDGVPIAAAWGQIPGAATQAAPAIDMGTTVLPFPTIDLDKTSEIVDDEGDGEAVPGDVLRYTITVTNRGISPVDDLVVNDVVPANTTYVPGSTVANGNPVVDPSTGTPFPLDEGGLLVPPVLAVGETRTVVYDLLVDDPLPPGVTEILNEITLESDYGTYTDLNIQPIAEPGSIGDRVWDDADEDGVQDPLEVGFDGLTVELVNGDDEVVATTTTATVGPVSGVYAFDDVYPGTYTVRVVPGPALAGRSPTFDLDGTGTAHEASVTLAPAEDRVDVDFGYGADAGLSLDKTVYAGHDGGATCDTNATDLVTGESGDDVTYCFTVTNTGATALVDLTLDDADLAIDETDLQVESGSLANLAPGDSVVLSYDTDIDGDLTNTATATGFLTPGGASRSDTDTAEVNEIGPGITLEKTVYRGHDGGAGCEGGESVTQRPGGPVTYCFRVTNSGETNLSAVTFSDPDLGISEGDQTHALLTPGQSHTFHVETTVDGDLPNTATAEGTSPAGAQPTDDDTASVDEIHPTIDVQNTIYAGHTSGAGCDAGENLTTLAGADVTWCFTVTNTGDVPLTDVTLEDLPLGVDESDLTVLSGSLATMAPGAVTRLYLQVPATADVNNSVTATGVAPIGPDVTDTDTAALDVIAPAITLDKTVYLGEDDGAGCGTAVETVEGEAGQAITWCFTITNTGDSTLSDLMLEDLPLGIDEADVEVASGDLTDLAPTESVVLFYETSIDGNLINVAEATGTPAAGPDVSDEDGAGVTQLEPDVLVTKTVYPGHDGGAGCPGTNSIQTRSGDDVTWCVRVENTGELELDVHVTDPDADIDTTITDLVPDEVQWVHAEGTSDGDLVNVAEVVGTTPEGDEVTDDDDATIDETHPALTLTKTVYAGWDDGAGCGTAVENVVTRVGGQATWCFTVANTGDVALTDVSLSDLPLGIDETDVEVLSGSLATLPVGQSVVFFSEWTTDDDLANIASATATPPVGDDVGMLDTASSTVIDPSITLEKTVYAGHDDGASCDGDELVVGLPDDDVTWCFTVTSGADSGPLTDLSFVDLPLGVDESDLTLVSGDVTPLAEGTTATFYLETSITDDVANTATVSATPQAGPDVSDTDTAAVDEVNAAISVDKTVYVGHDDGASCEGGELSEDEDGTPVTWCFTVTNTGDATLTDLRLDDADLDIDESDMTVLSGSLSSVPAGGVVSLYVETTLDDDLENTVTVTGTPPVGPDVTDSDSASVDELVPSFTIAKTVYRGHDSGASCEGVESVIGRDGDAVTWCVLVTNTGDTDLDVHVTDPDIGLDETISLAPGEDELLYVEDTVSADLLNTASADAETPRDDQLSDSDTALVDEVHPSIEVEKTVYGGHDDGAGCPGADLHADELGQAVTWCFELTNTGDTTLTDVTLDDADLEIDEGDVTVLSGSLSSIPAGDTVVLYLEGTLDEDLENTATVTAVAPVGPDVSDSDDAEVQVLVPGVSIQKTVYVGHDGGTSCEGGESILGQAGDEITWCFVVTNTGEVELDVTVEDPQIGFTQTVVDLAPGEDVTLHLDDTVDGDLDPNTATVTGDTPDGDEVTDDDTAEVDEIHPSIHVEKTIYAGHDDGAGCEGVEAVDAEVDDAVTWCFVITNTGDVTLDPVTLLDLPLSIDEEDVNLLSGDFDSLAPSGTIVAYYEDVVSEPVANTVTVGGASPDGATVVDGDVASVSVVGPEIGIAKTVVFGPIGNGDGTYTLIYRLRVANTGTTVLNGLQVTDDLSDTFGGVRHFEVDNVLSEDFTVNEDYTGRPGHTELLSGTDVLPVTNQGDIDVTVTVDPGRDLGPYLNSALASGTSPGGHEVDDESDSGTHADPSHPNPDEPGDTTGSDDPVPVEFPAVDLVVAKSVEDIRQTDAFSAVVDWRIVVANRGPGDDPGPIVVTDELDEHLTFISATGEGWECDAEGQLVTCVWDAALPAGFRTNDIQVLTDATTHEETTIINAAHVESTRTEGRLDNNDGATEIYSEWIEFELPSTLPRTGATVGGLVLLGLGLVLGGRILMRRSRVTA